MTQKLRAPRSWLLILGLLGLFMTGCSSASGSFHSVLRELLKSQSHVLFGHLIGWGMMGGFIGMIFSLVLFFMLRAVGAYTWEWKHAKWFRLLTAILLVGAGTVLGGFIGAGQGALSGGEVVLRKSQLAEDVFPIASDYGAEMLARVYLQTGKEELSGKEIEATIERFRNNEWELNVVELLRRVDQASHKMLNDVIETTKAQFQESNPEMKGQASEGLLFSVMSTLARALAAREARNQFRKLGFGLDKIFEDLVLRLPEAAKLKGDPETMSQSELSEHLTQKGLVPLILVPIRHIVRSYQLVCVGIFMAFLLLPILGFFFAEMLREKTTGKAEADSKGAAYVGDQVEDGIGEAPAPGA